MGERDVIHKTGSKQRIAFSVEEAQATVTGKLTRSENTLKFGCAVF